MEKKENKMLNTIALMALLPSIAGSIILSVYIGRLYLVPNFDTVVGSIILIVCALYAVVGIIGLMKYKSTRGRKSKSVGLLVFSLIDIGINIFTILTLLLNHMSTTHYLS
jgi:hypothetical protein